jgi:hypothetical protein
MAIEHSNIPGAGDLAGRFHGRSSKQAPQMLLSPASLKVPQKAQLGGARKSIKLTDKCWHEQHWNTPREFGLFIMKAC